LAERAGQFGTPINISLQQHDCLVLADPERLRTVLHILVTVAVSKATAASAVQLATFSADRHQAIMRLSYTGQGPTSTDTGSGLHSTMGMLNPVLAQEFLKQVVSGHDAELELASTSETAHTITLSLPLLG
jgi:hypothetical protein